MDREEGIAISATGEMVVIKKQFEEQYPMTIEDWRLFVAGTDIDGMG